ncbi:hypothetical protein [Limibacterium fermenti]|uniref:hypothetical protein n=1 Tax=Limibacterium fermenti TaxID=3229863 RepID=UPI003A618BF4
MSNLSIKVNLMRVPGALLLNLKGKLETKQCVVIPVEDSGLYVGEKGVYLNLTAIEYKERKYDDSHFVKMSVDREVYEGMTEDERLAIPIVGGLKPIVPKKMPSGGMMDITDAEYADDLPF